MAKRYAVRHPGPPGHGGKAGSYLHSEHKTAKAARASAQKLANKLNRSVDIEWDTGYPDDAQQYTMVRPKQSTARGKKAPRRTYKRPPRGEHGPHGPHSPAHFA